MPDTPDPAAETAKTLARELDATVARKVMGWKLDRKGFVICRDWPESEKFKWGAFDRRAVPHFSSDLRRDYEVHVAMRGRDKRVLACYFDALWLALYNRWAGSDERLTTDFDFRRLYPMNFYEVGDYSRAAIAALKGRL